jgi:hypothetical protein
MDEDRTEYVVEWIDAETLQRKAEAAVMRASYAQVMAGGQPLSAKDEIAKGIYDWCETDEAMAARRFPSLAMAKGWATKNRRLDWFEEPRVFVNHIHGPHGCFTDTVAEWRFDGEDALSEQAL